ncbi:MAG: ATP-dependent helicase [Candidatus Omnitrophota bacterium]
MKSYKLESFSNDTVTDYRKNLNPQQFKVVEEADGASLVLAGAGSGKTRVLIYRLAYLLEKGVPTQNILLVTFTNRAANEMTNRAEVLLKSSLSGLWAGTFHHIGNVTLRKEAQTLGYSPNFTIADKEDAKDLLEDCLEDLGLYKKQKMFPKKDVIYSVYNLSSNTLKSIDDTIAVFFPHIEEYTSEIRNILRLYQKKKQAANVMDFCDLLTNWLKALQHGPICEKYSRAFQHILVDEYQDTNKLQFEILKLLSSYHNNILVVGDDAQSIYSFRAADINNILNFPKIFKGAKIFKLETNYRSSPQVLSLANEIIKRNINQFPKTLQAVKTEADMPCVVETKDVYQQAKFIGQKVIELNHEGIPLNEIAVLLRSRFQALELEMELLKRSIPYVVRGGQKFFEQAHIKDTLSYLKIILNPQDEISFKRAVCLHKGIGRGFAYKIWDKLAKEKKSLEEIGKSLPKKPVEGFKEFRFLFEAIENIINPKDALKEILKTYKDYCYVSFDNADERILDLEELAKMSANYSNIKQFLLDLGSYEEFKGETRMDSAQRDEVLVLSTIHQAKGLEWEAVFIIGFCEHDFPHPKALISKESLEEERRLFYVATTRAKTILYITYPQIKYTFKNGLVVSQPSMFLYELSKSNYEEMTIEDSF